MGAFNVFWLKYIMPNIRNLPVNGNAKINPSTGITGYGFTGYESPTTDQS